MIEIIQTRIVRDKNGSEHIEYLASNGKRYRHNNHVRDIKDDRYMPAGGVAEKSL